MPVTALDVHSRSLVLDGRPFGAAGAYEKLAGTLHFAVDPTHPLHTTITDLSLAPRGADGRVAFQSDFYLLRPVDPRRGNRRLSAHSAPPARELLRRQIDAAPDGHVRRRP